MASVKLLVPYVLSRDKLVPKRINGMDVTGEDMLKYVKVSTFYGCTLHSAFNTGVTVILKNHSPIVRCYVLEFYILPVFFYFKEFVL